MDKKKSLLDRILESPEAPEAKPTARILPFKTAEERVREKNLKDGTQ